MSPEQQEPLEGEKPRIPYDVAKAMKLFTSQFYAKNPKASERANQEIQNHST